MTALTASIDKELLAALKLAAERITAYHQEQKEDAAAGK